MALYALFLLWRNHVEYVIVGRDYNELQREGEGYIGDGKGSTYEGRTFEIHNARFAPSMGG